MKSDKSQRLSLGITSLVIGLVVLALKWVAYLTTHSTALLSDAVESIVNVVASVFMIIAVFVADLPADKNHPYGHGKIENFSAAFEGGLISFASVFIFAQAVHAFLNGHVLQNLEKGLYINFAAGALNGVLGFYLVRYGKKHRSGAVVADGHHVLSDFYTTLAVVAGLVCTKYFNLPWMDSALAIFVAVMLAKTGFDLVKGSVAALLDEEDESLIKKIVAIFNQTRPDDVISIHALRTMRSGRFTHIDVHITVPEFYQVHQAHELVEHYGTKVIQSLGIEGECHSHIDPCNKYYCENCSVSPCAVREKPFTNKVDISMTEALAADPEGIH